MSRPHPYTKPGRRSVAEPTYVVSGLRRALAGIRVRPAKPKPAPKPRKPKPPAPAPARSLDEIVARFAKRSA